LHINKIIVFVLAASGLLGDGT